MELDILVKPVPVIQNRMILVRNDFRELGVKSGVGSVEVEVDIGKPRDLKYQIVIRGLRRFQRPFTFPQVKVSPVPLP